MFKNIFHIQISADLMKPRWTLDSNMVLPEAEMPGGKRHHVSKGMNMRNCKTFE